MFLLVIDAAITGGIVALALAAIKAVEHVATKRGAPTNGKAPSGFYGSMLDFRAKMLDTHVGPGAMDQATGTPRWWGVAAVGVLEEIRDEMKESGDSVLKAEILRYIKTSDDARDEMDSHRAAALETQTTILKEIADTMHECEFCQEAHTRRKLGGG